MLPIPGSVIRVYPPPCTKSGSAPRDYREQKHGDARFRPYSHLGPKQQSKPDDPGEMTMA
jgi:hypothetical protein